MKCEELARSLGDIHRNAPDRQSSIALILFGIKYAEEIRSVECTRRELFEMAGVPLGNVEVRYGMQLSEINYVILNEGSLWF